MVDALMRQLGLNPKRKNGRWNELFGVYQPDDYRGIVQEYKDLRGLGVGGPSV